MLGKKQISNSDDWAKTWNNISNIISFDHIKQITLSTINYVKEYTKAFNNVAYCWSGGKDSLVLQKIIELSGLDIPSLLVLYPTEYPEMEKWLLKNKPKRCVVKQAKHFTYEEINNNLELLFPDKEKYIASYLPPRWKCQKDFRKENNIDLLIMGRRKIDGNNCSNKCGTFNPLADWTHEEILGFIYYNNIELPPCYFYPRSWRYGTHCWTERGRLPNFPYDNFDELMLIDEKLLFSVKDKISIVEKYLSDKKYI